MPHQKRVVDYLDQNPDIKGVLVNHYMGTGKTFLALGYGEAHPEKEIVILAPPYLRNSWRLQMAEYKVKDPQRYQFLSYEEAAKNIHEGMFANKILIIDEAHNLIRYLNSTDEEETKAFAELYRQARMAPKILALSGTPIYQDISDLGLLLNLVSGEDLVTYGKEEFRIQYSEKIPFNSFWRGKMFESNVLYLSLPVFFAFLSFALMATPLAIIPGAALGAAVIPLVNNAAAPLTHYPLRKGRYDELVPHFEKYLSYFRFENPNTIDFPTQKIIERSVPYSPAQMDFFLRFIEEDLSQSELAELLKEYPRSITPNYLKIEASRINRSLKEVPGSGREIGNFTKPEEKEIPPKFIEMAAEIEKNPGNTAIYSNYYENGTKRFYDYLAGLGLEDEAVIIAPNDSDSVAAQKIADYNEGRKKIILFNFTEGVSLFKTRQLHVMEPVLNLAILEQVIGRAVRFRSHATLKENERHVDVYLWQSILPTLDLASYQLKRQNWRIRYGELSQYSNWGPGMSQIDPNYYQKLFSPDQKASMHLERLRLELGQINETIKAHSIESRF